jgi:hypothetical protein
VAGDVLKDGAVVILSDGGVQRAGLSRILSVPGQSRDKQGKRSIDGVTGRTRVGTNPAADPIHHVATESLLKHLE